MASFFKKSGFMGSSENWKPELIAAEFQRLRSENQMLQDEISRCRAASPQGGKQQHVSNMSPVFGLTSHQLSRQMLRRAEMGMPSGSKKPSLYEQQFMARTIDASSSYGRNLRSVSPPRSSSHSPGPTPSNGNSLARTSPNWHSKPARGDPSDQQGRNFSPSGPAQIRALSPAHGPGRSLSPPMQHQRGRDVHARKGPSLARPWSTGESDMTKQFGAAPHLGTADVPWRASAGPAHLDSSLPASTLPPSGWLARKAAPPNPVKADSVLGRVPSNATLEPIARMDMTQGSRSPSGSVEPQPKRVLAQIPDVSESFAAPRPNSDDGPRSSAMPMVRTGSKSNTLGVVHDGAGLPPAAGVNPRAKGFIVTALRSQESLRALGPGR